MHKFTYRMENVAECIEQLYRFGQLSNLTNATCEISLIYPFGLFIVKWEKSDVYNVIKFIHLDNALLSEVYYIVSVNQIFAKRAPENSYMVDVCHMRTGRLYDLFLSSITRLWKICRPLFLPSHNMGLFKLRFTPYFPYKDPPHGVPKDDRGPEVNYFPGGLFSVGFISVGTG